MTGLWELLAGSVVFAWMLMYLPGLRGRFWLTHLVAVIAIAGTAAVGWSFGGVWIATLAPFGVVLPGVCLAASVRRAGLWDYAPISRAEKLIGAALIAIAVMGTIDVLPIAPYAWFYAGWQPAVLVGALAIWAYARNQTHLLVCFVLAQLFWLLDIGSSNLMDQVTHALLCPAMVVSALKFRLPRARRQAP